MMARCHERRHCSARPFLRNSCCAPTRSSSGPDRMSSGTGIALREGMGDPRQHGRAGYPVDRRDLRSRAPFSDTNLEGPRGFDLHSCGHTCCSDRRTIRLLFPTWRTAMNMKHAMRCATAVSLALVLSTSYAAGDDKNTSTQASSTRQDLATDDGQAEGHRDRCGHRCRRGRGGWRPRRRRCGRRHRRVCGSRGHGREWQDLIDTRYILVACH